jgi:hypothetical protein
MAYFDLHPDFTGTTARSASPTDHSAMLALIEACHTLIIATEGMNHLPMARFTAANLDVGVITSQADDRVRGPGGKHFGMFLNILTPWSLIHFLDNMRSGKTEGTDIPDLYNAH